MRHFLLQHLTILLCVSTCVVGCGGGGGGGGDQFYGAANVDVRTNPSQIDTGDRTQVTMELSDVHKNGIAVKIRFPSGLSYVKGTAFLSVGAKDIDVDPTFIGTETSEELTYIVIFLSQEQFRRSSKPYSGESGTLRIELVGRKTVIDGEVEVDPDVNDLSVEDSQEFNMSNPGFVAEGSASIEVVAQ